MQGEKVLKETKAIIASVVGASSNETAKAYEMDEKVVQSLGTFPRAIAQQIVEDFVATVDSKVKNPNAWLMGTLKRCATTTFHAAIRTAYYSFIHSFMHSFVHSFIHSFIHSFTRSFIHSSQQQQQHARTAFTCHTYMLENIAEAHNLTDIKAPDKVFTCCV